ncbi:RdgB/HAM1 family non-canonical purine NTP pyrophosphatase [Paenalcaligenes niemegkensis]|uniref:RdgB/HAM1 family non-canonical purine NTP pyrophosphatase n=1 Tax=Paenalcaligenes niemegkensis TaxID=2895469 RepID=UPI001EE7D14A|nr:RdgB/HAM1 family non-canonical purine NTP pyrophosphatase [Paenalcaligenes niemegkensis]MCQ9616347.1 RdgB/HAM1 family non-canonical purine NTP pyrophosphatase [Paenalcaligenes niemegkensis]
MKVVLASNNPGKLREFSAILSTVGIDMVPQGELGVSEADEPFQTFVENALAKARHASEQTGLPALADDSGLSVHALNGGPGVYSARFALMNGGEKSDAANNQYLVQKLQGVSDRRARYVAVLVYVRSANDPCPIITEGCWDGSIVAEPAGHNGFGYDPHFYVRDLQKTAAELSEEEKNKRSHRAQALKQLLERLQQETVAQS